MFGLMILSLFLQSRTALGLSFVQGQRLVVKHKLHARSFTRRTPMSMMPEGPEVRTLVDQLQDGVGMRLNDLKFLSGRYVRGEKPTGFSSFSSTMSKDNPKVDIISEWRCKGKFIYIVLDEGKNDLSSRPDFKRSIWVTLGMTGRFVNEKAHLELAGKREARWVMELVDPSTGKMSLLYYYDTRNFGTLRFSTSHQELLDKLESLGPDIFYMNENDFVALVAGQKRERNICKFLMDQGKLCGVGNYILAEGLYRSYVDPFCNVQDLDEDRQRFLFRELQTVAMESYDAQGMTREEGGEYRTVKGDRGQFEFKLRCYGREVCGRGKPVRRETNGPHGRTIWYTDDQLAMPRQDRVLQSSSGRQEQVKGGVDDAPAPVLRLVRALTESSWSRILDDQFESEYFRSLAAFLEVERKKGAVVFPPQSELFSALNFCALEKVKVVIVGQDPYHGPGQGHGLAFSVRKGVPAPPSLKNIFREAIDDVGIRVPAHGNLQYWAEQGVLLLNTVLTVRQGEANSHKDKGWESLTDAIIAGLNDQSDGLVFLLWGNPAHRKAAAVDRQKHVVICTSHPSPLGATKTQNPFLGSKCFSRANSGLVEMGKEPIDWNVDP